MDVGANGERRVREVIHALAALTWDGLANVSDDLVLPVAESKRAAIAGLAATCGIERRLVQLDGKAVVARQTRRDGRVEFSLRHMIGPFPRAWGRDDGTGLPSQHYSG